ncbi:MAG: Gfo/Idh/MocA family oxidoreductase [Planctomyces sp.]|nr:Gfo/Idh/MocA family oxidoreductase [Planctomyces sp.]
MSTRRRFLQSTLVGAAAAYTGKLRAAGRSSSDQIVLGLIGPGGMGMNHVRELCKRTDVTIAAVCDVDSQRAGAAAEEVAKSRPKPRIESDLRKVLDDPEIDAVFIATPDHWHAPASILALDAGKHVYVEKPCCHNIREGRLMADAVERSGKLLQVGTQSRSGDFIQEAIQRIHEGEIGEVIVAKAWNSQRRGSIGRTQPSDPPSNLDFDTWVGPAPLVPYRTNLLHGVWRWWYDFGCGDIGNDGVHDIDVALWGLNVKSHPERMTCLGGRYVVEDDQQFPDTQYAVCEYPNGDQNRKRQMIFEQRDWSPYTQEGYENGSAWYGTKGLLVMGHVTGWKMFRERNELVAERTGSLSLEPHHTNFFDGIRGTSSKLNADIQAGLLAAGVVHFANIAARQRAVLEINAAAEQITNHVEANAMIRRKYRDSHWAVPKNV